MDIKDYKSGNYASGFDYRYFKPTFINHSFVWSNATVNDLLEKASLKLGELNSFSKLVPDTDIFIAMHTAKEAIESSRIEGTQTNIEEALVSEDQIEPELRDDWQEVQNYIQALNSAIQELAVLPLSNRLIKKTHKILMSSVRGESKAPGEFRRSQNWIGGATLLDAVFVPPSHELVPELMSDLELFLQNSTIKVPHLIKIAIAHYQFETIHPFLDGNGRIGRLLITLYFVSNGILHQPLLYLSSFFEKHKALYYDNLTFVRTKDDLTQWIIFFLTGIIVTAEHGVATLSKVIELKSTTEKEKIAKMGKRVEVALVLLQGLFKKPVVSINDAKKITSLSVKASSNLVSKFVDSGILVELTRNKRNRLFAFQDYLNLFREQR